MLEMSRFMFLMSAINAGFNLEALSRGGCLVERILGIIKEFLDGRNQANDSQFGILVYNGYFLRHDV